MRIACSNIAWSAAEDADALRVLADCRVQGVEVAPTRLWPEWVGASRDAASAYAAAMAQAGFQIPSMQSLLFGRPELQVFGSPKQQADLVQHMRLVAELAAALGAKVLVFGSPKNRDPGDLGFAQAMRQAVDVFRQIGQVCADAGVVLGIEANPSYYNCRFITHWREAEELVRSCNHPGVALHLDTACTVLAGDDPIAAVPVVADILAHVHMSEPDLGPFHGSRIDHAGVGAALRAAGYTGWCSVEMRRAEHPLAALAEAARLATACYG